MSIPSLCLAFAAVLQVPSGDRATWTDFAPAGGGFSVRMPSEPKETKVAARSSLGIAGLKQFVATDAGCTFAVKFGATTNPRDPAKANLARVKRSFLAANKAAGAGSDVEFEDHPGWETEYATPGPSGLSYKVRFYVVDKRVIELATIVPAAKAAGRAGDIAAFLESFKLDAEGAEPEAPAVASRKPKGKAAGWAEFSPKGGGFTVQMPGQPEFSNQPLTVDGVTQEGAGYQATELPHSYMITYTETPRAYAGLAPKIALGSMRDGVKASLGATLVDEKEITSNGVAGREVRFKMLDGRVDGKAWLLLGKGQIYQLSVAAPAGMLDMAKADKFFDSFKLTGAEANPDAAKKAARP